jgi:hypothetical protein
VFIIRLLGIIANLCFVVIPVPCIFYYFVL